MTELSKEYWLVIFPQYSTQSFNLKMTNKAVTEIYTVCVLVAKQKTEFEEPIGY